LKGFGKGAKGAFETTKGIAGTAAGATGRALGSAGRVVYNTGRKGYDAARDAAVEAAPAVKGGGSAILQAVLDNAATLALVALLITVASTNFMYWMNKRRHNKQRHRENTEALLARVCELSRLLGEISGRPRVDKDADDEDAPPGGCWGDGAGGQSWEDDDAQRDLRAAIFAKDRSVLPQLPDDTRSTPVLHALSTAQRNRLLASCVEVLQAYDRCNDAAANSSAVFPLADVIVYGMVSVGCVVAVVYMYTQLEGGAMFDCARKISAALEDARAGKPGAVAFLRAEIDACSQAGANGTEPMDVVKSVGKWAFVAVLVLATVMLSKESAVRYENRGDEDCAR
jgi:Tfp pilus assembly protein FimT